MGKATWASCHPQLKWARFPKNKQIKADNMGPQKLIKKEQDRPAPPRWTTPDACLEKIERLQKRVMELVETLGQDIALSIKKKTGK